VSHRQQQTHDAFALCFLRNITLHHMQSLQVYLSCVNRMRNILTTGVYSDYTKTRVGNKRLFFLKSALHTSGTEEMKNMQKYSVCADLSFYSDKDSSWREGNSPRQISTQARPPPLHIKNTGHGHTHCTQAYKTSLPPTSLLPTYI
jgi:hypothetical protein